MELDCDAAMSVQRLAPILGLFKRQDILLNEGYCHYFSYALLFPLLLHYSCFKRRLEKLILDIL